ncbi:MAG: hypothetical protein PHV13_06045 [Candidatus ainarchaeum sp.]|nr:hypothetical protein [Candidatus ainarchaeum sp.]
MAVPQRIRGPKLELLDNWPLNNYDALKKAGDENRVIASNKRIKQEIPLLEKGGAELLKAAFPCWTGTMAAFPEFNVSFRESRMFSKNDNALVYHDFQTPQVWMFLLEGVPEQYMNKPNALLVVEHPDYSITKSGNNIVVKPQFPDKVGIIAPFAYVNHTSPYRDDGFYVPDQVYGIPAGYQVLGVQNSSYLFLPAGDSTHGKYGRVGLVSSSFRVDHVAIGVTPSFFYHVLVEAPEK